MAKTDNPRESYLAIARQSFAAHGFHGVSLAALAKEAGVTKQALLHFFGTKEGLYADVLTDLAERLRADIAEAARPDPADHLRAYFQAFRASAVTHPTDVQLIVRALLDSDAGARKWPLKHHLDELIALVKQTDGGGSASEAAILAWLSQVIGIIQYMAISRPTISGMYGPKTAAALADRFEAVVDETVLTFVQPVS